MSQMKTGNPLSMMHASSGRALFPTWKIVPYCPIYKCYLHICNKNRLLPMAKYVRITVVSDGCVFWNLSSCKKSRIKRATRITTLKFFWSVTIQIFWAWVERLFYRFSYTPDFSSKFEAVRGIFYYLTQKYQNMSVWV